MYPARDAAGIRSYDRARKPYGRFASDQSRDVAVHVRPCIDDTQVGRAVDLDIEDSAIIASEAHIEIASTPVDVSADPLAYRHRQAVPSAQCREVELGQRMDTTLDVVQDRQDQSSMADLTLLHKRGTQPIRLRQPLLDTGDHDRTRPSPHRRPRRTIYQSAFDPDRGNAPTGVPVSRAVASRNVQLHARLSAWSPDCPGYDHVNRSGFEPGKALFFGCAETGKCRPRALVEHSNPPLLPPGQRTTVQHDRLLAACGPAPPFDLGTQMPPVPAQCTELSPGHHVVLFVRQSVESLGWMIAASRHAVIVTYHNSMSLIYPQP